MKAPYQASTTADKSASQTASTVNPLRPASGVLDEYPETEFITFEQSICAIVNGRRINIALQRGVNFPTAPETNDQETYNLIRAMTHRASLLPAVLKSCAELLAIVRIQNGNLHDDINKIQSDAIDAMEAARIA